MIIKFNGGRGALLCEHCKIIVMDDLHQYEREALEKMNLNGEHWLCERCAPDRQKLQNTRFVDVVNEIAPEHIERRRRSIVDRYNQQ